MWKERTVAGALREATEGERHVAAKFDASWCGACQALDREVLSTPAGRSVFSATVTAKVDFDHPEGAEEARRWAILELPTVIVLSREGAEVGRIVGYDDAEAWLAAARAAVAADDPVPALWEAAQRDPDDAAAQLALGHALLSRDPDAGQVWLERVSWRSDRPDEAAEALFLLGRYQHRVRRDPATARFVWQQLACRFPGSRFAGGAWDWHAKAQAELGHVELGAAALQARAAHEGTVDAIAAWARFVGRHRHEAGRAAVRDAVMEALGRARGAQREELETLALELGRPLRRGASTG